MKVSRFQANFITSMFNVVLQLVQSLVITSYIQRYLGVEAYGYISVIVNMVNIAGVLTVALTSLCSRNMVVLLQKNDVDGLKHYFNTIFFSCVFLAGVCSILFAGLSLSLEFIMQISEIYINQVRLLLWIVGADFVVQLLLVPFLSVVYYEEKLSYYYLACIACNLAKILVMLLVFEFWQPIIWASYLGGLVVNCFAFGIFVLYTHKKVPYLKCDYSFFNLKLLKEILSSGSWISISKLASILISSCSTYLSNIFIGVYLTGVYASIVQIQSVLSFVTVAVVNIFLPQMYRLFADDKQNKLAEYTKNSYVAVLSVLGILAGGLIVYGNEFMSLWILPEYLQYDKLIVVSVCYLQISYSAEVLNQYLITLNNIKVPAIVAMMTGVSNILLSLMFVCVFDYGIYGIVCSQLIVTLLRSGIWFPLYAAKVGKLRSAFFIRSQWKGIATTIVTVAVGLLINKFITIDSWGNLIICCVATGMLSLIPFVVINRNSLKKGLPKR